MLKLLKPLRNSFAEVGLRKEVIYRVVHGSPVPLVVQNGEGSGGYWRFFALSNGGFYMAPTPDRIFKVACENGFDGVLSADALGITACLYAYSHLSFGIDDFAETSAPQYHSLRDFTLEHAGVGAILRAID